MAWEASVSSMNCFFHAGADRNTAATISFFFFFSVLGGRPKCCHFSLVGLVSEDVSIEAVPVAMRLSKHLQDLDAWTLKEKFTQKWKFGQQVPIYFNCFEKCRKTVLLWSSRNVLWTSKLQLERIMTEFFHFWVNFSFKVANMKKKMALQFYFLILLQDVSPFLQFVFHQFHSQYTSTSTSTSQQGASKHFLRFLWCREMSFTSAQANEISSVIQLGRGSVSNMMRLELWYVLTVNGQLRMS